MISLVNEWALLGLGFSSREEAHSGWFLSKICSNEPYVKESLIPELTFSSVERYILPQTENGEGH